MKKKLLLICALFVFVGVSHTVLADWDPEDDYKMHYPQLPNPQGWDIAFYSDMGGIPVELADDWECSETGPVSDIHFWVSWRGDDVLPIQAVNVKIYSNNPLGPNGWSEPNTLLWSRNFQSGQFKVRSYGTGPQGWCDPYIPTWYPDDHLQYFQVNITDINNPYIQQRGEIYWLSLEVFPATEGRVGWKTAMPPNFMDDAVWREPGGPWIELKDPTGSSLDLSFVITTGPIIKYIQRPDLSDTGIDVDATFDITGSSIWLPQILADDFPCTATGRITDIHIWSSWYHDEMPDGDPNNVEFTLSIHADIPAGDPCNPNDYSMPGEMLWMKRFLPGEFSSAVEAADIPEGYYVPCEPYYEFPADYTCWRYDFYIDPTDAFMQQGDPNHPIIYWLDVQARLPVGNNIRFGWKTSLQHWNDDAVFAVGDETNHDPWQELRYPPGHPFYPESIDLAFAITTDAILPWRCYAGQPDEAEWIAAGEPNCWCWPRQCVGDADGKTQGKSPNIYWVSTNDLTILKSNWQIVGLVGNGNCADFDHKTQGKSPNIYRVSTNDLTILKSNWQIPGGPAPICSPGNCDPTTCP